MSENPYRRNAELSPRLQRIGGLLFAAALATPFAVITLVGKPTETTLFAATEAVTPDFRQVALVAPSPTDMVALAAAAVGPVTVLRPGGEETAPLPPEAGDDRAAKDPVPPVQKPAKPGEAATPEAPDATASDGTVSADTKTEVTQAPRTAPALPADRGAEGTELPPDLARESAEAAEKALALDPRRRREIQVRLTLMGLKPGGADGIFGKQTRGAISAAQAQLAVPETGYMTDALLGRIEVLTEEKLAEYKDAQRQRSKRARLAAKQRASDESRIRLPSAKNSPQCLRDSTGQIKQNQSLACDVTLLEESLKPTITGTDETGDVLTVQRRPNTRQPISRR